MIKKSTTLWRNLPYPMTALPTWMVRPTNDTPPISTPKIGIRMSDTRDAVIFPKAPPMITATARSITAHLTAAVSKSCTL
jgi:hypothetical protein